MKFFTPRRVGALGLVAAGAAIGGIALGSAGAEPPSGAAPVAVAALADPAPTPEAEPVWAPKVSAYQDAERASDKGRTAFAGAGLDVDVNAEEARAIPAPDGAGTWTIAPAPDATCVSMAAGRILCAHAERLKRAGASVSWNVPSPEQQADGEGEATFRGIAVDDVSTIAVIDDTGRELARTSPKHSAFALKVPFAAKPASLVLSGANGTRSVIQVN